MILRCEILELDIPDVGRNHILEFFLVSVRKNISVQEFYSDSLFQLLTGLRSMQESASPVLVTVSRPG